MPRQVQLGTADGAPKSSTTSHVTEYKPPSPNKHDNRTQTSSTLAEPGDPLRDRRKQCAWRRPSPPGRTGPSGASCRACSRTGRTAAPPRGAPQALSNCSRTTRRASLRRSEVASRRERYEVGPGEVGGRPRGQGPAAAAAPATPPFQEAARPGARGPGSGGRGAGDLGRAARRGCRPLPRRRALTGDDGLVLHGVDHRRHRLLRGVHGRPASPARPPAPHGQPEAAPGQPEPKRRRNRDSDARPAARGSSLAGRPQSPAARRRRPPAAPASGAGARWYRFRGARLKGEAFPPSGLGPPTKGGKAIQAARVSAEVSFASRGRNPRGPDVGRCGSRVGPLP